MLTARCVGFSAVSRVRQLLEPRFHDQKHRGDEGHGQDADQ